MSRKFTELETKVYHEYRAKGYSHAKAMEFAKGTAGKVFWEKNGKRKGERKIRAGREHGHHPMESHPLW